MPTVHVALAGRSYPIHIGRSLSEIGPWGLAPGTRVLVVSDATVSRLYGDRCLRSLRQARCHPSLLVVPAGERSKRPAMLVKIWREAVQQKLDRHSAIVALGGGVVGDLAGFAAATLYRGVTLVQVPTTLLAMVDSSVGGKTAVNLPEGKNLVGAFHQPSRVWIALETLATLPQREYRSGLAEVVKYGVIADAGLFERLERDAPRLLRRDPSVLADVVARCCEIKARVVEQDERDTGCRAILNFGHTLGHALESCGQYRRWRHGEAVAVGMVFAGRLSMSERDFSTASFGRLVALLKTFHLPVGWPARRPPVSWAEVRGAMATDKKARGTVPRLVLVDRLGASVWGCRIAERRLREAFDKLGEE